MKYRVIISVFVMSIAGLYGQGFAHFLSELDNGMESVRQELLDNYIFNSKRIPIVENTLAHFIFKCEGSNPHVAGDFTGWNPNRAPMINISGTDWWYLTKNFEKDARLDYQFVYNDSIWTVDPLNPFKVLGGFGYNSELRMSEYNPPLEIYYVEENQHGTIIDTTLYKEELGNSRKIQVYLPPQYYSTTKDYPLVLVHDGSDYLSFANMDNILDNLISDGKIQPVIAVFVPPIDRTEEYVGYKKQVFTKFIINDLIRWIDKEFRTIKDPSFRLVMGSSYGGNISLWIAKEHPNVFGLVGAFSPFIEDKILDHFSTINSTNLKIFILHGKYDHIDAIHESVFSLRSILDKKSIDYIYKEYSDSHSYGFWKAHINDLLIGYYRNYKNSL